MKIINKIFARLKYPFYICSVGSFIHIFRTYSDCIDKEQTNQQPGVRQAQKIFNITAVLPFNY